MISYRDGYRYQLAKSYSLDVGVYPEHDIDTEFIKLSHTGVLLICRGYAWNGADGIVTVHNPCTMRASLVHDALYQLLRSGLLPPCRDIIDLEYKKIALEDGMSSVRAWYHHRALKRFGGLASNPTHKKEVFTAP